MLITAGRTLALRFNHKWNYLRSFVAPESLFIDIMMNVPLIFYAARETGDRDLYNLAVAHCRTTEKTLVRPDGSTAHEGIFDLDTGAFLRQSTHQGLRADSAWSRGLAWSLYGFGTVFTYTAASADLAVAIRNADYFLSRCPDGMVPPWDFDVPDGPDRIPDSSAAAIAASGLLEPRPTAPARASATRADRYRAAALAILDTLCSDQFLAWSDPGWEGVVEARRLSLPPETRCRRVGRVGRLLLPRRPSTRFCESHAPRQRIQDRPAAADRRALRRRRSMPRFSSRSDFRSTRDLLHYGPGPVCARPSDRR